MRYLFAMLKYEWNKLKDETETPSVATWLSVRRGIDIKNRLLQDS